MGGRGGRGGKSGSEMPQGLIGGRKTVAGCQRLSSLALWNRSPGFSRSEISHQQTSYSHALKIFIMSYCVFTKWPLH